MKLQDQARKAWLFMFNEGGTYTAREIATLLQVHSDYAVELLCGMRRRKLVQQFPPAAGERRLRYGITGTCQVPAGMSLAEVQIA